MPFYEYECQSCKFYTEVLQKITDPPLSKCPSCGKNQLKKLVSAPVFRLKGAGWYETDFKSRQGEQAQPGRRQGAGHGVGSQAGEAGRAPTRRPRRPSRPRRRAPTEGSRVEVVG